MCAPFTTEAEQQSCEKKCGECADVAFQISRGRIDPMSLCLCACNQANKELKAAGLDLQIKDCSKVCGKVKCPADDDPYKNIPPISIPDPPRRP
jgi:hypothetical protein